MGAMTGKEQKTKILIVEDNEKNLKLFKLIVASLGYEPLAAGNGEEGIKIAMKERPDLILMDIQMPIMDGLSAVEFLKSEESTKHIPVIALTSYAMKGDKERFLEYGFSDYLSKPVKKDDLIKAARNALKRDVG